MTERHGNPYAKRNIVVAKILFRHDNFVACLPDSAYSTIASLYSGVGGIARSTLNGRGGQIISTSSISTFEALIAAQFFNPFD